LDPELRLSAAAPILGPAPILPIIVTNERSHSDQVEALQDAGAHVLQIPCDDRGIILNVLLDRLKECGLQSVFVEGGAEVVAGFIRRRLVDHMIIVVMSQFAGAEPSVADYLFPAAADSAAAESYPRLTNLRHRLVGKNLLVQGDPIWEQ
jgi:riboflavin biosynthesis pyrimidine reductase